MVNARVFRFILLLAAALTLSLVGLGGYVRGTGAGLACPDWPLCFGRVVPPTFGGGVAQEWLHRVVAKAVGLLCIIAVAVAYRERKKNPRPYYFAWMMLALVIIQGIFGGLTVLMLLNPIVVTTHLALGTLFFQLLLLAALEPKNSLGSNEPRQVVYHPILRDRVERFKNWVLVLLVLIYCQILLGGFVGSSGASLACPDLPYCRELFEFSRTESGAFGARLSVFTHFGLGSLITLLALSLVCRAFTDIGELKSQRYRLLGIFCLICTQVALGLVTVRLQIPVIAAVVHLMLAQAILLGVASCYRALSPKLRIFGFERPLPIGLRAKESKAVDPTENVGGVKFGNSAQ